MKYISMIAILFFLTVLTVSGQDAKPKKQVDKSKLVLHDNLRDEMPDRHDNRGKMVKHENRQRREMRHENGKRLKPGVNKRRPEKRPKVDMKKERRMMRIRH